MHLDTLFINNGTFGAIPYHKTFGTYTCYLTKV